MLYLYAARNFSTLVGLASPEPLANMYDATYYRATWVLTALDAGFWTAMKIRQKWLRDLASMVFSVFYLFAAEKADEKVRKVRGNLTVDHLRISWNKGNTSPYLRFFQGLLRPRFTRWPPRAIRIPRQTSSDYKEPVSAWLYFDGPLSDLEHHNKIILDIPGGGFVAMDPRCNDDKLLSWASKTGLPILSLDYKKAPEYPYPYALNECYDAYTTIIRTRGRCIGLPGRDVPKVVVTGDSAGGTLATSMALMIIESGSSPIRRFRGESDLPVPDGLVLFYPCLDMNIGSWMSDAQMSLIQDRSMRGTNKRIARRKSMQYNVLAGTPHQSDDEDDVTLGSISGTTEGKKDKSSPASASDPRSPNTQYAHSGSLSWTQTQYPASPGVDAGSSYHAQPLRTRLAMSSMISYFNDRVLTAEMMRAMIILYIGPHNRPDFSQDYLLSPILTPDVLLARFPKTYFLTGERDPLVDDTVVFAGRLRRVRAAMHASGGARLEYRDADALAGGFDEKDAAEMVLIPRISHGFLQFPAVYPPAWKLIDRSARWIEDAFVDAARREKVCRVREPAAANGGLGTGAGVGTEAAAPQYPLHHSRRESSGDEDKPLEIGMTRVRGRSFEDEKKEEGNDIKEEDEQEEGAEGSRGGRKFRSGNRRRKGGRERTRGSDDKSLVKLDSSDDLLARRMQGLAGGLTGLGEEE